MPKNNIFTLVCGLLLLHLRADAQITSVRFSNSLGCVNTPVQFTDESTANTSLTEWTWDFDALDNPGVYTSKAQNPVHIFTQENKNYLITLKVRDSNGNLDSTFKFISIFPTPKVGINATVNCVPDPIILNDNSTITSGSIKDYQWTINGTVYKGAQATFNPPATGTFLAYLTLTSDNNCTSTDSIVVNYGPPPSITFTPSGPVGVCAGDSTLVTASGGATYEWNNGITNASNYLSTAGFHVVKVSNSDICFSVDSIELNILAKPSVDAGKNVTIALGETVALIGSGNGTYRWTPSTGLSSATVSEPLCNATETTLYFLTVRNANGCSSSDSVLVTVNLNVNLDIPNLITPNGDGYNDGWDLGKVPGISTAKITILNRYGWEVFKTDTYKNNWKGTYKDKPLPDGAYIYLIDFEQEGREIVRGVLQILRN